MLTTTGNFFLSEDNFFLSDSVSKSNNSTDFVMCFHEPKEMVSETTPKEIGRLKMQDGELTFEGDADASAKRFFDFILSCNSAAINRYRRALERISCTSTDMVSREIAKSEL